MFMALDSYEKYTQYHKHMLPNIKRQRIPEARLSFVNPNLPWLLEEIETQVRQED